jgi:hypothetical protein
LKQRNELSAPLESKLESTFEKNTKLTLPGKYFWNDEIKEINLRINIYKINGYLIPVYNNKVLTPEYYDKVYSISKLNQGICEPLDSNEILECLWDMPKDLFIISDHGPRISVAEDLNRLSKRLKKEMLERDWNNLAMQWYNKGLI